MRKTVDFLLYDWLDVERTLCTRARFSEHSRETFDAVLDTCQRVAAERFAPFNRIADVEEPRQVGNAVVLPQSSVDAVRAYVDTGMYGAGHDVERGGLQLPFAVELAHIM